MAPSGLDALVADSRVQVVDKRRYELLREGEEERQEILMGIIEEFELKSQTFEILKNCNAEVMLSILCVLIKGGKEDAMSNELCEWFAKQPEKVRSFPLCVTGFNVSKNYFELLKDDPSARIRILMAEHPCVPPSLLSRLRADRDLSVQKAAMANSCTPLAR